MASSARSSPPGPLASPRGSRAGRREARPAVAGAARSRSSVISFALDWRGMDIERGPDASPGAREPRADRPDRDLEGLAYLGVGEVRPGEEQQRIRLLAAEPGEDFAPPPPRAECGHALLEAVEGSEERVDHAARVGPQLAQLVPAVSPQQVGRDAEQPGPGVGPRGGGASAIVEGDQERLRGELV